MTDFKPGDVVVWDVSPVRGVVTTKGTVRWGDGSDSPLSRALDLRRLVVIDPEDRDAAERLSSLVEANGGPTFFNVGVNSLQAALREFATPTPPRPDEPTGLGAVVEDADGLKWVSVEEMPPFGRWYCGVLPDDDCSIADGAFRDWSDIDVVRVLSEGVTP